MRLSGPFLDRVDLHVHVARLPRDVLQADTVGESSESVRTRVSIARAAQLQRQGCVNRALSGKALVEFVSLSAESNKLLNEASDKMVLSLRAVHRVLRVARTIADLDGVAGVDVKHVVEALSYRGQLT
jgi:magnesium chelatase family protein